MPGTHCVGRSVSQHEADCFPAGSEWADIGHFEIDADLIFFCGCDFLLLPLIHVEKQPVKNDRLCLERVGGAGGRYRLQPGFPERGFHRQVPI